MSEKNVANNAPVAPTTPAAEETQKEPVKTGLFTKAWMWLNAPAAEALHPVKYHKDVAALHNAEADKLASVNPNDRPTVGSFLRGLGKGAARLAVGGLAVIGLFSLKPNNSNNENQELISNDTIPSDDVIE